METDKRSVARKLRNLAPLIIDVELALCLGGARGRFFCSRWPGFALTLLCTAAWYMPRVRLWLLRVEQRRRTLPCCALAMIAGLAMPLGGLPMDAALSALSNALMLTGGVLWLSLGAESGESTAAATDSPTFLPLRFESACALPIILAAQMAGISAVSHSVYLGVLARGPSGP